MLMPIDIKKCVVDYQILVPILGYYPKHLRIFFFLFQTKFVMQIESKNHEEQVIIGILIKFGSPTKILYVRIYM